MRRWWVFFFVLAGCKAAPIGNARVGLSNGDLKTSVTTTSSTTLASTTSTTVTTTTTNTTFPVTSNGYCSGGGDDGTDCRDNDLCFCNAAISKAMSGKPVDMGRVDANIGSDDPRNVFHSGGSENIPVVCRTAKYWVEGDPTWFENYFEIQLRDPAIGLFGRELFSTTYFTSTVGAAIAVREKASRAGHTALAAKASEWLKAYWSILALAAHSNSLTETGAHNYDQSTGNDRFLTDAVPNDLKGGYGLVLPGNRSYVNETNGGTGLQYILLSMALNHPTRRYQWTLDQSPGYYGGLCAAVKASGYYIGVDGKVNLSAFDAAPEKFGLTPSERQDLKTFIESNGTQGLNQILSFLNPYKLNCELTIIRSTEGIAIWFGNETGRTPLCSRSKGGSFSASVLTFADRKSSSLSRATLQNWPEEADTWKEGNTICSESADRPKRCLAIPGGQIIYRLTF